MISIIIGVIVLSLITYWAITLSENIGYLINKNEQQSKAIGSLILGFICLTLFVKFMSCSYTDGVLEEKQFNNGDIYSQNYDVTRQIEKNDDDTFNSVCLWVGGFVVLGLIGGFIKKQNNKNQII